VIDPADDAVLRAQTLLETWRERGDDRVNSVRFRFIEAMTRRAADHEGEPRRVLDERIAVLCDAYERDLARHRLDARIERGASQFAALLDDMRERASTRLAPDALLDDLRAVWSRVSAEKRVRESLAQVPKNAGPLNSSNLVHRSLSLMREVSPEYLEHFLGYLDSIAWMEEMVFASSAPAKDAPRNANAGANTSVGAKKGARAKTR
jgi:hypothetical protein